MITKLKKLAKVLAEAVSIINEMVAEDEKTTAAQVHKTAGNSSFTANGNDRRWQL